VVFFCPLKWRSSKKGNDKLLFSHSISSLPRRFLAHSLGQKKTGHRFETTSLAFVTSSPFHTTHGNLWASIAPRQNGNLPKPRAKTHVRIGTLNSHAVSKQFDWFQNLSTLIFENLTSILLADTLILVLFFNVFQVECYQVIVSFCFHAQRLQNWTLLWNYVHFYVSNKTITRYLRTNCSSTLSLLVPFSKTWKSNCLLATFSLLFVVA